MRREGRITIASIFTLAIIAYVLFLGYTYGEIWITSLKLKQFAKEISTGAFEKRNSELVGEIIQKAETFGIDLYEEDIEISRDKEYIYISIYYQVERNMLFWTLRKDIEIHTKAPLSPIL